MTLILGKHLGFISNIIVFLHTLASVTSTYIFTHELIEKFLENVSKNFINF